MKKHLLTLSILISAVAVAQPVRLHLMGGFANYTGDIQQKRFTLGQAKLVVSAGGTFNITDKIALRGDISYGHVGADDKKNTNAAVAARNLNFTSKIQEVDLMVEYDILSLYDHRLSPYVFAGVGIFHFSPYTFDSLGKAFLSSYSTEGQGLPEYPDRQPYKRTQLNIPFGGGVKYALSDDIHLGVEVGIRKLFTDYLDDVSKTYVDQDVLLNRRGPRAVELAFRGDEVKGSTRTYPKAGTGRGGVSKDFYYFGQFRISFRMNWFDNSTRGNRSRIDCPTNL